jgi:hypothetical protein
MSVPLRRGGPPDSSPDGPTLPDCTSGRIEAIKTALAAAKQAYWYYERLVALTDKGDGQRREVAAAKTYLSKTN